jgi:hypothetical protein
MDEMARIKRVEVDEMVDADLLRETGRALHGERFQLLLAKELSIPPSFLSDILSGKKALPAKHRITLAELCHRWLMDVPSKVASVEAYSKAWRAKMLADRNAAGES